MTHPLTGVTVVVPARDEETLLPACLDALHRAADLCPVPTRVVVVADSCVDATASIARAAGVDVLTTACGSAGAARRAGITDALTHLAGRDPATAWLACTDADTLVPPAWLARQVALADAGADCVVGTVEPDGVTDLVAARWRGHHTLDEDHPHVHGANLGLRASAYLDVGGFAPIPLHEDADLVRRLRAAGHTCVATDTTRVTTSGRLTSRVDGGFATYLRHLGNHGTPPPAVAPPRPA